MTTSNTAADRSADKSGPAKLSEKLAEKRRALGRGLESLLPGPRVVTVPVSSTLPQTQSPRKDGAPASSSPFSSSSGAEGGRASPVSTLAPVSLPDTVLNELQAVASGRTADGETIFLVGIDLIDPNPYQTRRDFNEQALAELRDSIAVQGGLQPS